ncbi:MAG: homoserine dehydrogenase, partial [Candidatus Cellulosilyticum pullistercoris]|nr:homoserine dehydrogenase [Candidatus Cellulosilyticum pullistercoris]
AKEEVRVGYFVRIKADDEEVEEKVRAVFGEVEVIDGLDSEYAFITKVMKERQFAEKMNDLGEVQIISTIRIQE